MAQKVTIELADDLDALPRTASAPSASTWTARITIDLTEDNVNRRFRLLSYLKAEKRLRLIDEVVDASLLDRGAGIITSTYTIPLTTWPTPGVVDRMLRPGGLEH